MAATTVSPPEYFRLSEPKATAESSSAASFYRPTTAVTGFFFVLFIFKVLYAFFCLNAVLIDFDRHVCFSIVSELQYILHFFFLVEKERETKQGVTVFILAAVSLFSSERGLLTCFVAPLFSLDAIILFYSILNSFFSKVFWPFLPCSILWPLFDSRILLNA